MDLHFRFGCDLLAQSVYILSCFAVFVSKLFASMNTERHTLRLFAETHVDLHEDSCSTFARLEQNNSEKSCTYRPSNTNFFCKQNLLH